MSERGSCGSTAVSCTAFNQRDMETVLGGPVHGHEAVDGRGAVQRRPAVDLWQITVLAVTTGQGAGPPMVRAVMTMLWMWGRGRPWGLVWCSKEAMTQCWGLADANRVRPVPCMNSSTA